jgi:hypothetical protein
MDWAAEECSRKRRGIYRGLPILALAAVVLFSFALSDEAWAAQQVDVEAETMTLSGSTAVNSNGAASGGQAVAFFSNGSASSTFEGAATRITLDGRGSSCQGDPHLEVYVDNTLRGTVDLTSTSFADYAVSLSGLSTGTHALRVSYANDYASADCDRNAHLDYYVLSLPGQLPMSGDPVLVGAGKIGSCESSGDEATAKLLDVIPGTVFTLGDNAYQNGTAAEYAGTKLTPGNHDYNNTPGASGYFGYFGASAGDSSKGYYSYNRGAWHVIALNTRCDSVGDCGTKSPMVNWLRQDLASHPSACTLAYFHTPRFSSGYHGNRTTTGKIWNVLYGANADVVVSGGDHDYERFAPQDPSGAADPARGIREFVVGTGGAFQLPFGTIQPNSRVRSTGTYGVLKLTLHPGSYDWRFVPVAGKTFTDSGTTSCR